MHAKQCIESTSLWDAWSHLAAKKPSDSIPRENNDELHRVTLETTEPFNLRRKHRDLWRVWENQGSIDQSQLAFAERQAYPWLKQPVDVLRQRWQPGSMGIVYTVAKKHVIHAYTSIRGLRHLGSHLPIAIMYGGESDLPPAYRQVFEGLGNITFIDMVPLLHWDIAEIKGYAYKPFAMLYAPFEQVILADADACFLQAPEGLFEDEGYRKSGTLFFFDRTTQWKHNTDANMPRWVRSLVPELSATAQSMRAFRGIGAQEQESAVVVVNKKGDGLSAMLLACALNAEPIRGQVTYRQVWGDKETFWIAFEVLGLPYTFMPSYGGALGMPSREWHKGKAICGHILHVDRSKQPLWWNGGVAMRKDGWPFEYMDFTHYLLDNKARDADWSLFAERGMGCLRHTNFFGTDTIRPLSLKDRSNALWMINVHKQALANEAWRTLW
ncbi:hypothetical protein RI367_003806 [Sorochytrium milnesiophthora]